MNSDNKNSRSTKAILQKFRADELYAAISAAPIFRYLGTAAISAVVSAAPIFGASYPFGLSMIAAAGDVVTAAAATVGTLVGTSALPSFAGISAASVLLFFVRCAVGLFLTAGMKKPVLLPSPLHTPGGDPVPITRSAERLRSLLSRCDLSASGSVRPALSAAAAMAAGTISLLLGGNYTARDLIGVFFLTAVTPLCTSALTALYDRRGAAARQMGVLLLLFAAARALHAFSGLPFDAGILFAFVTPLVLAYRAAKSGGVSLSATAVAAGVLCGIAIDPATASVYGAAAVAACLTMKISSAASVCASWLIALAIAFAGGGIAALSRVMPEITTAAAIMAPLCRFSLIPVPKVRSIDTVSVGTAHEAAAVERSRADEAILRVQSLAGACGDLSKVFGAVSARLRRPSVSELREICDRSTAERCRDCENRVLCWERESATTADTVCRITAALHKDGRVSASVIPKALAARCHKMDDILSDVNDACAARAAEAAKTDKTDVLSDDLASFSEILTEASTRIGENFTKDETMSRKLRRAFSRTDFYADNISVYGTRRRHIVATSIDMSRMRMGNEELRLSFESVVGGKLTVPEYEINGTSVMMTMESRAAVRTLYGAATRAAGEGGLSTGKRAVNGDVAAEFTTDDGRYAAIISDGMGTGGEASLTARLAVTFLKKMMMAGVSLKAALTMLNNYLRARNMECSAGMDIMEIDLYGSEVRFVKSGAAPSFVVRDGRLFRLASKTVPIGILRALDAEMIRFTVEPGDTVVMLSDGVMAGFDEAPWLCDLLATPTIMALSPKEIAERIVAAAATESRDDITAAVIKVV